MDEILDDNTNKENSIVISNHLSQADFLYIFNLMTSNNKIPNNHLKIASYYYSYLFPGMGITSYLANNILISENKKKTIDNIEKCKLNKNDILFLYPEGGSYHQKVLESSNNYCIKNNIDITKNCLYPKTTGIDIIHKNTKIDTLYSISMQYEEKHNKNIYSLFGVNLPNRVYMKFNKTKTDNPTKDTVNIFRNIDTYLDEPLDKSKFIESSISLCEKISLTFYTILFIIISMNLCSNKYSRYYMYTAIILYYSYLAVDIVLI